MATPKHDNVHTFALNCFSDDQNVNVFADSKAVSPVKYWKNLFSLGVFLTMPEVHLGKTLGVETVGSTAWNWQEPQTVSEKV